MNRVFKKLIVLVGIIIGFEFFMVVNLVLAEEVGVTQDEIIIGSSSALTGHSSYLGTQFKYGALTYLNYINEQGGVNGRKIKVIWLDDAYDPPLTIANTVKLINEDKVFCLFSYVGTPTTVKIIPMIENQKIPLIGLFTGANALREPFKRYIINVRSSYYQETGTVVKHAIDDLGFRKIAVFYQYDAYGMDGLKGTELALEKYGLTPVATGSYIRGTMEIQEALTTIKASGAEVVIMIGTYDPCGKFIIEGKKQGFDPIYHNVSFVGPDKLVSVLGEYGEDEVVTEVVPPPLQTSLAGVEEYNNLLKKYFPDQDPNFVSLEGYINAKVLVEGLKRAGKDITREKFIDAIESIKNFDVGIGVNISFGAEDHQGLDEIYPTYIHRGQLVYFTNWKILKQK